MSVSDTPTQESQADQVSDDLGSDDAAVAALLKSEQQEEPAPKKAKTDEPEPADEPADESTEEAEEAEPAEDEKADDLVEVDIGGKTFEVAPEVQKAVLRQADYSRKMNEVAAVEKGATERMQQADRLVEAAEKLSDVLSEVKQHDAQLKRFENVPWQKLRGENPAEYAALAADLQSVRLARDEAMRKSQGIQGDIERTRDQTLASQRTEMLKTLAKDLKGWGDERGAQITQYAYKVGYTQAEIGTWTDARMVVMADKARRYDELQASKTAIKAKAQSAPQVVKPGSPRRADPKADAMTRLRTEKSEAAAVAAFLSRQ